MIDLKQIENSCLTLKTEIMSVLIRSIKKTNPQDKNAKKKFYAIAVSRGLTDLKALSRLLSDGSTTRTADVFAVLVGLVEEIKKELSAGRSVKLGDLGSFKLNVKSEGVDKEAEVTSNIIKGNKILYRPSAELKTTLSTIKYQKIK
jgi:predicted histone-like DNA-binding protein